MSRVDALRTAIDRSLRVRFLVGFGSMLLPLLLVAAAATLALHGTTKNFSSSAREANRELVPLAHLQGDIVNAGPSAYRAMYSGTEADRREFTLRAGVVDAGFAQLRQEAALDEERASVAAAEQQWQSARSEVERTLAVALAGRRAFPTGEAQSLAASLDEATRNLRTAEATAQRELQDQLAEATSLERRVLIAVGLLAALGAAVALLAGRHLLRSVLNPVRVLEDGASRLGRGELSHRTGLRRADELGELASAFDSMAADLEHNQRELSRQALHDPLTGMANRTLLQQRMRQALAGTSERAGTGGRAGRVAFLLVDLDGFKVVNDSLGHLSGDRVLVVAARRVMGCLRGDDIAARLGGDEFGVLLLDVADAEVALALGDRLVAALREPFLVDGREVYLDASVGVALARPGDDDGPDELLRNADLAMYVAKRRGKGRCELFEPTMHDAAVERMGLEVELRRALVHDELVLHFQPIVDLDSGLIVGSEALVRWQHPRRGLVPPLEFIPLAEETGLVVPLGEWVLEQACTWAQRWRDRHRMSSFAVSVNLSARQLQHADLVSQVSTVLRRSGLEPDALVLEITETATMIDGEIALERLAQLKALGVRIAIDDFGTGYCSLGYLAHLPVDVLKIDRTFTNGVAGTVGQAALAQAVVAFAGSLRLVTVAEGVERHEQVEALREMGCHLAQGYALSPPVEPRRMGELLAEQSPQAVPAPA